MLFALVYTCYWARTSPLDPIRYVECRNHYAIEIPKGDLFEYGYIRCEAFNKFQKLIEAGKMKEAKKLVFFTK